MICKSFGEHGFCEGATQYLEGVIRMKKKVKPSLGLVLLLVSRDHALAGEVKPGPLQ